jgi:hypothetical protein
MYAFGSWFEVGSWFFSSVTSNVRKSLEVIVPAGEVEAEDAAVAASLTATAVEFPMPGDGAEPGCLVFL